MTVTTINARFKCIVHYSVRDTVTQDLKELDAEYTTSRLVPVTNGRIMINVTMGFDKFIEFLNRAKEYNFICELK